MGRPVSTEQHDPRMAEGEEAGGWQGRDLSCCVMGWWCRSIPSMSNSTPQSKARLRNEQNPSVRKRGGGATVNSSPRAAAAANTAAATPFVSLWYFYQVPNPSDTACSCYCRCPPDTPKADMQQTHLPDASLLARPPPTPIFPAVAAMAAAAAAGMCCLHNTS